MYPKGNLFIKTAHGRLEAVLKKPLEEPRGLALVCHPHPLGGGTMHNKVVFRAAAGLVDAGLATLRFNFRGVGASTGKHDDGIGEKQDVLDALNYITQQYPALGVTFAGFSFGSRFGLEAVINNQRISRFISIGTPVDKYHDYDFLLELRKPILFIHGDQDEFGSLESLEALVTKVAAVTDTTVKIFNNCGHFFDEHLNELRVCIRDWELAKQREETS
ncbi:MAG: alpha/beta hydrolase [Pyrinomonadaceae bacterium]